MEKVHVTVFEPRKVFHLQEHKKLFKGSKVALKMWSCICKVQQ